MNRYKIYGVLVFVMFLWGVNVVALKLLVGAFAPVTMTSFRILFAGLAVLLLLKAKKKLRKITKKELLFITIVGFFNVVCHHFFLSTGLKETSASNGGLILGLSPILTTICAVLFLGTRLTFLRFLGVVSGFSGVAFIVLAGSGAVTTGTRGDLFVFLSILTQAVSYVFIRRASATIDAPLMTGWMLVTGSVFLFVISLLLEPNGLATMKQTRIDLWLLFFGSALLATAFGHMIYNQAVQHIGPAESSIFVNLNPFFALVSSAIFLQEEVHSAQLMGFLFIVMGVLLGSGLIEKRWMNRKKSAHSHVSQ
ncbi:DMT family transporter [Priestia megaterium]|nr:DMT family transporter [Priestia megaterium]